MLQVTSLDGWSCVACQSGIDPLTGDCVQCGGGGLDEFTLVQRITGSRISGTGGGD